MWSLLLLCRGISPMDTTNAEETTRQGAATVARSHGRRYAPSCPLSMAATTNANGWAPTRANATKRHHNGIAGRDVVAAAQLRRARLTPEVSVAHVSFFVLHSSPSPSRRSHDRRQGRTAPSPDRSSRCVHQRNLLQCHCCHGRHRRFATKEPRVQRQTAMRHANSAARAATPARNTPRVAATSVQCTEATHARRMSRPCAFHMRPTSSRRARNTAHRLQHILVFFGRFIAVGTPTYQYGERSLRC